MTTVDAVEMASRHFVSAAEVASHVRAEVELRHEHPDLGGYRTGMPSLDRHLGEALYPGRLIVVGGESGQGKTAFAGQLAVAFASQVPTALVSLEDDECGVAKRHLSNISRQDVGAIRQGFRTENGLPQAFTDALDSYSALALSYVTPHGLTVEAIGQSVAVWAKAHNVGAVGGVVIIDQLSHIAPSDPRSCGYFLSKGLPVPPALNAAETKVLEWQTWFLRIVAERLGVLMVLLHQLNEAHGDARPGMSSIRSSRGIVHKADAVIIPWRPKTMLNPDAGPGQPKSVPNDSDSAEIIGAKGREVGQFVLECRWDGAHQRFVDPAEHPDTARTWIAPQPRSDSAKRGAARLMELREKWEQTRVSPGVGAGTKPKALTAARDAVDVKVAKIGETKTVPNLLEFPAGYFEHGEPEEG